MKLILILGIAMVLGSCGQKIYSEKTEPCTTSVTGDTVTLAYQKPVAIFEKCADNMTASIISIEDSRCPKDVQCVWAGKAAVVLQLAGTFNVSLELGKQIDTSFREKKFSFLLVDVFPYPAAGTAHQPQQSTALLRIIKSERLTEADLMKK